MSLARPTRRALLTAAAALAAHAALPAEAGDVFYRRPFRPGDLNSTGSQVIAAWWRARDRALMTDDGGGLISSFKDATTGLAVTASTGARPTWGATSFNSTHPGLTFDGIANVLQTASLSSLPTGSTPGEIWFVGQFVSPGANNSEMVCYGAGAGATRALLTSAAGRAAVSDNAATLNGPAGTNFTPLFFSGSWSGTNQNGYLNGTAFTGNPGTIASLNTGTTKLTIGAFNSASPAFFAAIVLSDILIMNGVLSTSNRQKMEGYFAWTRGLSSVLPQTHPYKFAPP